MENKENLSQEETINEEIVEETAQDTVVEEETNVVDTLLQAQYETLNDQHQRLQAEYANYRRRTQEEKATMGVFANEKILTELIPVVDSMEMAVNAFDNKEDNVYKGVELVYKNLVSTLEKFGVEVIQAQDMDFDPNLHLAVMQESVEGVEPNKVVMVLQKGYKLSNKVLRPSMVKVSC